MLPLTRIPSLTMPFSRLLHTLPRSTFASRTIDFRSPARNLAKNCCLRSPTKPGLFRSSKNFSSDGEEKSGKEGEDLADQKMTHSSGEKRTDPGEKLTETQKKLDSITEYYSQFQEDYEEDDDGCVEWIVPQEETFSISTERGETGVFDVEELVEFLREEKAMDICCIRVPQEAVSAQYLLICSAFSVRHMASMLERINKVHKTTHL